MKILLITDADSIWVKEYIDNVLLTMPYKCNIYILSLHNSKFCDYYDNKGVIVYTYYSDSKYFLKRFSVRRLIIKAIKREVCNLDYIQISFVTLPGLKMLEKLWSLAPKHIVTLWGSDLLRVSNSTLKRYDSCLNKANRINMLTENMRIRFTEYYGNKYDDKLTVFDFGCPMYDVIDSVRGEKSKFQCKEYWGINGEQIVIPIGYNSIPEQQHDKIIDSIKDISGEVLRNVTFVFHFGYGNNSSDYREMLETKLKKYGFNYLFIDRFLDKNEVAMLRIASDVFLYGQTTDALSTTLVEYLYAGSMVISPKWLEYHEINALGVEYYTYNDFISMKNILQNIIETNFEQDAYIVSKNRKLLWNFNSWAVSKSKWQEIYGE